MPETFSKEIYLRNPEFALQVIDASKGSDLHELCVQAQTDPAIMNEFGSTVEGYIDSVAIAEERVQELYSLQPSEIRLCFTLNQSSTSQAVGMLMLNALERTVIMDSQQRVDFRGINCSMWLLEKIRGKHVGREAFSKLCSVARNLSENTSADNPNWKNRVLYTGIQPGNIPSIRAATANGWGRGGQLGDSSAHDAWFADPDWLQQCATSLN